MSTGSQESENALNREHQQAGSSQFIRYYLWKYRGFVTVGLLALIVVDLLEIVPPILLKDAVDAATSHRPAVYLCHVALAYVAVAFVQAVCRYGWRMYLIRSSMLSGRDLRARFSHHLLRLSASFFDRRPIGDLMSLATNDTEAVRQMLGPGVLTFADSIFYFLTVPIAMLWLSPKLTLLAFLPLPVIPWLVMRNDREVHRRFQKVQETFSELSAMTQEGLNGVRVLKGFAREDVKAERFRGVGEKFIRLNLRLSRVQTSFGPLMEFTMSLGMALLLFVGGRMMIHDGEAAISLGTFVAFQRYIQKMVWPMAALGMAMSSYQRARSSSGRLQEVLAAGSDVREAARTELPAGAPTGGSLSATGWRTAGRVELRGLAFRFPGTERDILSGISLTIEPGERLAVVGAIGSGKSALLSLLPRLYPVSDGMLFIDGVDVNRWPLEELRRQVGYVSQDVFLFSETVAENIAYGMASLQLAEAFSPDGMAPAIENATQLACVHEEALGLVQGYRTRVGERGVSLSGGQKQRVTIARALIKSPSILVLDDALSSVDVHTEERILKGLMHRAGANTDLIAAHRISTVQEADRILVLEAGQVRQLGSHRELVRDRAGPYRRFYEQQRLREDLEHYTESIEERAPGPDAGPERDPKEAKSECPSG